MKDFLKDIEYLDSKISKMEELVPTLTTEKNKKIEDRSKEIIVNIEAKISELEDKIREYKALSSQIDKTKELTAVLIDEPWNRQLDITCYAHIGQHGKCSIDLLYKDTKPAKPSQYKALKNELKALGYKLKVLKRLPTYSKTIKTLTKNEV